MEPRRSWFSYGKFTVADHVILGMLARVAPEARSGLTPVLATAPVEIAVVMDTASGADNEGGGW